VQTQKDAEVVSWLGRIGAASAEHVMARFGMGRSWAYARLSRLVGDGLLEQKQLLYRRPGLYVASAEGLRWTLQERLGVYRLGPAAFSTPGSVLCSRRPAQRTARLAPALRARDPRR